MIATAQNFNRLLALSVSLTLLGFTIYFAYERMLNEGAKELIKTSKPVIIFEHGKGASDSYGTTPALIFDYFKTLDYYEFCLMSHSRKESL
jgi:hypothetical protein